MAATITNKKPSKAHVFLRTSRRSKSRKFLAASGATKTRSLPLDVDLGIDFFRWECWICPLGKLKLINIWASHDPLVNYSSLLRKMMEHVNLVR